MTWLVDADVTEPVIPTGVNASGGTESVININGQAYRLHTFTSTFTTGQLLVFSGGMVEVLVVGGGGAGGVFPKSGSIGSTAATVGSGGGGGGGVVNCELEVFGGGGFLGEYDITVGAGGNGSNGGDSAIVASGVDQVRAKGGGRGGNVTLTASGNAIDNGQDGASSGGGGYILNSPIYADQTTDAGNRVFGQGYNGSDAILGVCGAGGGAGQPSNTATDLVPSNGGNGVPISITGTPQYYGGGGAAFNNNVGGGVGGLGGGGTFAGAVFNQPNIFNGVNTLGGGGAGGGGVGSSFGGIFTFGSPGRGGSGIVIVRYPI